jgi:hypothetical protein
MNFVVSFFAGAFLCNAEPHGKGPSSPLVNFLWGMLNALICLTLLMHYPVAPGFNLDSAALLVGVLVMGVFASLHFGRVRGEGLF